ncbi:hypothetical protein [Methylobacterium brachiatum]|uniref:hypothetical protein n=1 Tax=Methylobacterium brachiatum TaxID=269660 RepID=UPI00244A3E3D|nr:hypothetical protein [Methylobacterium brachiatum]MDH2312860.1 hypothetical protein [Methylobacterium brachiatum]
MKTPVGVGGRYWRMQTGSGRIKFPFSPGSPTKVETDRYGVFAQIAYKLSDLGFGGRTLNRFLHARTDPVLDWSGGPPEPNGPGGYHPPEALRPRML